MENTKDNEAQPSSPDGEPGKGRIFIDCGNGKMLQAAVLIGQDGAPTFTLESAVGIIAFDQQGWYDLKLGPYGWHSPGLATIH